MSYGARKPVFKNSNAPEQPPDMPIPACLMPARQETLGSQVSK
jgi:hypothetical protein